jgi:hypothetical protein
MIPAATVISHPSALQVLCAIGIATGLVMFLYGLRPSHKRSSTAPLNPRPAPVNRVSRVQPGEPRPVKSVQVIRLTPEVRNPKISDMTQQQKIAAALSRAGISSVPWKTSEADPAAGHSNIQVITAPQENTMPGPNTSRNTDRESAPAMMPSWKRFLLCAGPTLALLSLYLMLRLKSLL